MEHTNAANGNACKCGGSAMAPFLVGLVAAIVAGWWLFPQALYSTQQQPLVFDHVLHVEDQGMACQDCHFLREDGSFAGIPTTEQCAECHSGMMGESAAEATFVKEYVETGEEVPWIAYQKQPDNVFFSHAVHSVEKCGECHSDVSDPEANLCNLCHPPLSSAKTPPPVKVNRLTGYTKDTMKMWQCEECHANANHLAPMTVANNACQTCHK